MFLLRLSQSRDRDYHSECCFVSEHAEGTRSCWYVFQPRHSSVQWQAIVSHGQLKYSLHHRNMRGMYTKLSLTFSFRTKKTCKKTNYWSSSMSQQKLLHLFSPACSLSEIVSFMTTTSYLLKIVTHKMYHMNMMNYTKFCCNVC